MPELQRRALLLGLGYSQLPGLISQLDLPHNIGLDRAHKRLIGQHWYTASSCGAPWSILNAPPSTNWRFEIRGARPNFPFGDQAMADIGRKEHYNRAELLGGYDQIVPGGLYEISFIRRVFSPSGPVTRRIAIFGQVHRAAADRQPNALPTLALLLDANGQRERAFISGSSERPYAGGRVHSQIKTIGAFSWNEWHHYRLLIRAHPTEGHVEVWRNGEQACLFDKVPIDYWSGRGPYFQFGIYARADSYNGKIAQETLVSEYDEISGPTRLS